MTSEIHQHITAILAGVGDALPERERQVLEQRFGLVDGYSRTAEEIARQFKTTLDRIRQLEVRRLSKMLQYMILNDSKGFERSCPGRRPDNRNSRE